MITLTIRVKLILKAFGYTATILVGAFIFAQFVWAATGSGGLGGLAFWSGIFLGILAVLTDELRKREVLLTQHTHERTAVVASSHTPELTAYALGTHQVSTATSIDLNVDIFDLHVGVRTDVERSKCVRSQHVPTHTPSNQITQD
jgi:hypothetical protein